MATIHWLSEDLSSTTGKSSLRTGNENSGVQRSTSTPVRIFTLLLYCMSGAAGNILGWDRREGARRPITAASFEASYRNSYLQ